MIIDDGCTERSHRNNLFSNDFREVGMHSGEHLDFETMTTIEFCTALVGKKEKDPIEEQIQ